MDRSNRPTAKPHKKFIPRSLVAIFLTASITTMTLHHHLSRDLKRESQKESTQLLDPKLGVHYTKHALVNSSSGSNCSFMIIQKTIDAHYETFESIALKYPLPFNQSKRQPQCAHAGLTEESPIVVDYLMPYNWHGGIDKKKESEGWGWQQYYEKELIGKVAVSQYGHITSNHTVQQRYIKFGSLLGVDTIEGVTWGLYSFIIEASCDMWGSQHAKRWLGQDEAHYCVFHTKNEWLDDDPKSASRSCFLNPQFKKFCWFMPTIYPKFTKGDLPPKTSSSSKVAAIANQTEKLNLCVGWKSMPGGKLMRDVSYLANAFPSFQDAFKIVLFGRSAKLPDEFEQSGLAESVEIHSDIKDYLAYQKLIASCHALIPFVHYPRDMTYFLGPNKTQSGRLSGMIAQVIGNQIPSLVHSKVESIYDNEFTAPVFVYDDESSFAPALQGLYDHYFTSFQSDVPPVLNFVYVSDSPNNTLSQNERKNQIEISEKYSTLQKVNFFDNIKCHQAIMQTEPRLVPFMKSEEYGPHKSDICRLAVLYLYGGYYLDNDTKVLDPLMIPPNKTFATVLGLHEGRFSQGIIIVSPRHPIIKLALDLTLDHYKGVHMRSDVDYDSDAGTKILFDAYQKAVDDNPSLEDTSFFLQEVILKRRKDLLSNVTNNHGVRMKMGINYCTAAFINNDTVYFLARAPGTSYC